MSVPPFEFVSTHMVDRLVMAHDASLYRLVPSAVARPRDRDDIRSLLQWCHAHHQHLTFRTAGTSLSGQAVTDGILVDLSRHWNRVEILADGFNVRVQPGVTGGRVNALLAPYGRKLGPDPASMNAAMVGGIVANNASGMCCGTELNSYHTVRSMKIILADGWSIDTGDADADARMLQERHGLHDGLLALRDEIRNDKELTALIRRKYRIKNTVGYSLNAFLDEDQPTQILARLLVGSEGTLGFIEEVVYRTIPDARKKYTAMFVHETLEAACATVADWIARGAAAVELMDDASIRSFSGLPHTPVHLRVSSPGSAALLVEFHDHEPPISGPWTTDPREQAVLWHLRKGLMPTIGAMRPSGTTMINEDIAVPFEHLASLVRDVQQAFVEFDYKEGIIFGHAKDGNIHFVVNQDFTTRTEIDRYSRFMDRIAEIVVGRYGGSLKAEHGTGRNMAPYVEREWGSVAMAIMHRIKALLDPAGILNPDVILSADPNIHLKHLKPVPTIDAEVDACIECGFCEHVCPTRNTSLTPRQRIVLRREMAEHGDDGSTDDLEREQEILSISTCAVDGMCGVVCPVGIDTGSLVKRIRSEQHGRWTTAAANFTARHWGLVDRIAPLMLPGSRKTIARGTTPLPRAAEVDAPAFTYVPSCPARWADPQEANLRLLSERCGLRIVVAADAHTLCCGQPFASKGFPEAATIRSHATMDLLRSQCEQQHAILITDTSTCAHAFMASARTHGVPMLSPAQFIHDHILPTLPIRRRVEHVVLHPGCGTWHTADVDVLQAVCAHVANRVTIPSTAFCCGQAGDHGQRHPEIPRGALSAEADEVRALQADIHVSVNAMCQSALGAHTQRPWISVFELLVRVSS